MKRIFAILFAAMLASQVWAYDFKSGDLYYNITGDNTVEVTRENSTMENYKGLTSVEIPETVSFDNITYIVIRIGDDAFIYCNSLTSVTIPHSVTEIGYAAFFECRHLTSVNIPNSVTTIGNTAFGWCFSLTSVNIPNSVTTIEDNAFYCCDKLLTLTIPNSVTKIGAFAFRYCREVTSITIPESVASIGEGVFASCSKLESISVNPNNSYYTSEDGVLYNKDKTVLINYPAGKAGTYTIPESVTSIGCNAA
ncbi:MAG: leucine-rich repeat domain-containing protein [Salinivirgaceae bacterium]|nr:leucine-rich repeat domain-containing protein [Salinivirgaceae bacterium]